MTQVTFIEFNGREHAVDAQDGVSLMQNAVDNVVPGIDGDCGGACACATCHIRIEPKWQALLPAIDDLERSMLDMAEGADDLSRLACQITVGPAMAGLVIRMPEAQH